MKMNDKVNNVNECISVYTAFRSLLEEMEGAESPDFFKSVSKVLNITIAPETIYKSHGEYLTKTRVYLIDTLTRKIDWLLNSNDNESNLD